MTLLVSACLLGVCCRYDGRAKADPRVLALMKSHTLIPVCPEQLGGLPTPRSAAEVGMDGRVMTRAGEDVTDAFSRGARQTLHIARLYGCEGAVLKARSPSCGSQGVYDGTLTGRVKDGMGLTAALLKEQGLLLCSEETLFSGFLATNGLLKSEG